MGGQAGLTDAFVSAMVGMLGLIAALFVVASVLRLNGEGDVRTGGAGARGRGGTAAVGARGTW